MTDTEQIDTVWIASKRSLARTRDGVVLKFNIASFEGYVIVNTFEDGAPAEVFVRAGKEGSTMGGVCRMTGKLVSLCLKHGVPVTTIVRSLRDEAFEPAGWGAIGDDPTTTFKSMSDMLATVLARYAIVETAVDAAEVSDAE